MDEKITELAEKVMTLAQNSVSVNLRYLQNAIVMLKTKTYGGTVATDGKHFFYNPVHILRAYKTHPNYPQRLFVHTLLHCIFRDWFVKKTVDSQLWDICCDITAESIINELGICDIPQRASQDNALQILRRKVKTITALNLYEYFLFNMPSINELEELEKTFCVDDHSFWYRKKENSVTGSDDEKSENQSGESSDNKKSENQSGEGADNKKPEDSSTGANDKKSENKSSESADNKKPDSSGEGANDEKPEDSRAGADGEKSESDSESRMLEELKSALAKKWRDISERIQMDLSTFSDMHMSNYGNIPGLFVQNLEKLNREEYDYTTFLREFSVLTEVMKVSEDEFDYNFYTYGMNMYGNMPLIEPLEYKDDKRVHDFVIAIDTSGSVKGNIVQMFVQKTYNILKQSESFSDRINVHIIQCDSKIQEDVKITSQEEFDEYIEKMTIKGFGGTDFRPVFSYVNKLTEKGEFNDLRGLIYLTDGLGVFPEMPPKYKTAFILSDDEYLDYIPQWAMAMVIGKDGI